MTTKHHTREGYERLLCNICRESKIEVPFAADIEKCSDFELLSAINYALLYCNCTPFSLPELMQKLCKEN